MTDSDFDQFLKTARGEMPLPVSFRQGVWHRIESSDAPSAWFRDLMSILARPWGAAAGVAATVTLGLWLGVASLPDTKDSKTAYTESISPFSHVHRK